MAESNSTQVVDVSGLRWRNWSGEGGPPVIMNPAASTHALIAYCWAEASQALEVSIAATMYPDEHAALNDAIQSRLNAIVPILELLSVRSSAVKGGQLRAVPQEVVAD